MKQLRLPANMLPFGIIEADVEGMITALTSAVKILLLVCGKVIRADLRESLVKLLTHTVTGIIERKLLTVLVTVVTLVIFLCFCHKSFLSFSTASAVFFIIGVLGEIFP